MVSRGLVKWGKGSGRYRPPGMDEEVTGIKGTA